MLNFFLSLFLLTSPVLYEGRWRPLETVPEGGSYLSLEAENYAALAGTVYLQAAGKALKYPSEAQLQTELILFKVPFKWIILACYAVATLFFVCRQQKIGLGLFIGGFCIHTLMLAARCYVLLRPPVSNMTETILYVPWVAVGMGLLFHKRKHVLLAASLVAALLLLFLPSKMGLENVQAVLDSHYWLLIHVLMVVGSYGVFCVAGVCGHFYLAKANPSFALEKTLIQTLYLGTALLIGGTILGGVWAAESWGRFWDWDPKEAWAFISSGLYLIWIHAYRFKKIGGRGLAVGSIVGLLSITFTWYGVNYILGSGLHSYGFGNGGELFYYLFLLAEILFLITIFIKIKVYKK